MKVPMLKESLKIESFPVSTTTSASGKIEFSDLKRENVVLLPGAVNVGYNNIQMIPCYSNNVWAYQCMNAGTPYANTAVRGTGFYIRSI